MSRPNVASLDKTIPQKLVNGTMSLSCYVTKCPRIQNYIFLESLSKLGCQYGSSADKLVVSETCILSTDYQFQKMATLNFACIRFSFNFNQSASMDESIDKVRKELSREIGSKKYNKLQPSKYRSRCSPVLSIQIQTYTLAALFDLLSVKINLSISIYSVRQMPKCVDVFKTFVHLIITCVRTYRFLVFVTSLIFCKD